MCLSGCNGLDMSFKYNFYTLNSNTSQWIPFDNSSYYYPTIQSNADITVLSDLFRDYSNYIIWKFELVITVVALNKSQYTSLVAYINQPPVPGMCGMNPINGTTSTIFTIFCADWSDNDGGLTNYTFYGMMLYKYNVSTL